MTVDIKEAIKQLESLKYHCGSMISDPDDEWVKDVEAR